MMTSRRKFAAGLIVSTAGALLAEVPVNANGSKKRIVILGDSITAGYGLNPSEAYPALLEKKISAANLPYVIHNAGVSGDTTAGGLRRVAWALSKGADVLVVALGGNDGLRGISPEETKKNLIGVIEKARKLNPKMKIVIAGMQMPDNMGKKFTTRFREIFGEVAEEQKTRLVPFLLEGVGGVAKMNQEDRIHPTAEGQKLVAENVWAVMREAL